MHLNFLLRGKKDKQGPLPISSGEGEITYDTTANAKEKKRLRHKIVVLVLQGDLQKGKKH